MPVSRRRLAAAVVALVLAGPGTALGQSAGDEQYEDPFGGAQPEATPEARVPDEAPTAPAPTPVPAPAPGPAADAGPVAAAPQPQPAAQEQLPYTGAEAGLLAAAGVVLLGGGVALRLRLREQR